MKRLCLMLPMILAAPVAWSQEADELAKQLSNPVASLISVPLQYNVDFNIGSEDGTRHFLNIQPVIPTSISQDWNLITRVIAPVVYQDDVFGNSGSQFGLGDITPTFFLSPKQPTTGGWIWAVGPVFLLPTATDDLLGAEKWGIGPSAVVLKQTKAGWTYGVLANHIWSVAGEDDRADVSSTFLQPFLTKGFPGGRTLSFNFESSYDRKGDAWNVPMNIGYSKVMKAGNQLLSLQGGVRYYFETPGDGPDWGVRFALTLLYPGK
ncbi:transporter [Lysobacter niabensis]|uniref:transporter n=1 Tax=Agrilutibacter niabensis TaxID=380628 RepID=UPI003609AC4C